ncbi:malate synthase A [Sorangium sp. So ce315]|uniref:malate synthase A n=1 Tax=Sorangium sp. So ce315 TaxID=3133299 RepID=UPI003F61CC2A
MWMSQNHDMNLRLLAPRVPGDESVLTPEALRFLASLVRKFTDRVPGLLARRRDVQARLDAGERFDFLAETREVREGDWTVAPLPADLLDRRVEITGPVDPKMIINALNSGASMFMADFEDATSPTWKNLIEGQAALRQAARRELRHEDPTTGKRYALNDRLATLLVRPRGWHLWEKHVELDGKPLPGGLFDFGLFFFHNARELVRRGTGPYFYLPKMESHLEARLWNDVFLFAQDALGLPAGTIKATVLIETLPAAFEMDEILYELRQHSAGLNCGRWDYIFSFIKKLRNDPACVMPDRSLVTMEQHFLRSYTQLLVKTCHRRGVHAMGGMAAQIPIKSDPEANRAALEKVRADKLREVKDGHDGTWVAHPGLVPLAREVFDAHMSGPNQIERKREDVRVTAADLLKVPSGARTEAGLRHNIRVGVQYIEAWISGLGCVPLYNLMEDAATAEISRTQVWQWIRHRATLDDGEPLTVERFRAAVDGEMAALRGALGEARFDGGRFAEARELFERLSVGDTFEEFLTLPAYELLITRAEGQRS